MIKGVLFDMDGVLFNTERIYIRSEYEAAQQMGIPMDKEYPKAFCGMNFQGIYELLVKKYGNKYDYNYYLQLSKDLTFESVKNNGIEPMPYVESTLIWLKENNIKTAVASSTKTPMVKTFLEMARFTKYFDAVVGGDQVQNGKPSPDIFILAAQQLGFLPQNCAAVEDSHNGVRSAFAAGCVTIMVPDVLAPNDEMREKTAAILKDLSLLPEFISKNKSIN